MEYRISGCAQRRRLLVALAVVFAASCGGGGSGGGSSTGGESSASLPPPQPAIQVLAGHMGGIGNIDGRGTGARFWQPRGSAIDAFGNLYIADSYNHTIRKMTPAGVVTTVAGIPSYAGSGDGPVNTATFYGPGGLAFDRAGNLYIADDGNYTVRRLSPSGIVTTVAGTPGVSGYANGSGAAARFGDCFNNFGCPLPTLVADSRGNVFYGDAVNRVIRRIAPDGMVTTFAGARLEPTDGRDGTGPAAHFDTPSALAIDPADNLYVADRSSAIRKVTPAAVVTTVAGAVGHSGFTDGVGGAAQFSNPNGIAVDMAGNIFVADTGNHAIRQITADGTVTTLAGTGWGGVADGRGSDARFSAPSGISVDQIGTIYVCDTTNNTIRRINTDRTVTTIAGLAEQNEPVDGVGANARFEFPLGLAVSRTGDVFVADNDAATIRKIAPDGTTTTYSGAVHSFGMTDGPAQSARFFGPAGLSMTASGDMYVADLFAANIRKISASGQVTTVAMDLPGPNDDPAAQAGLLSPYGVATDGSGNVYVADYFSHTIRKIAPDGTLSTLAGAAGEAGSVDGVGAAARFNLPVDVATDALGNVYVADYQNHAIRKVTPAGAVVTIAGTLGVPGWRDGVGTAAGFYKPAGLAVDASGNVYVTDSLNHTIRKITPDSAVRTVVGTAGYQGFSGDKLPGVLSVPWRVAVSGTTLYITTARGVVMVKNRP